MIKVGQIYKQRKCNDPVFVVTYVEFTIYIVNREGITDVVSYNWINGDCELIAEYPSWQEAVNSEYFKND